MSLKKKKKKEVKCDLFVLYQSQERSSCKNQKSSEGNTGRREQKEKKKKEERGKEMNTSRSGSTEKQ